MVCYGSIPLYYPERMGECIAYLEFAVGLG